MKSKLLLSFLVIGTTFFSAIPISKAEPADIFKPLVKDIRQQLPKGLDMRLPSYIPASDAKLYPFVESDDKGLRVNIGIKPDCASSSNPASCTVGIIAVLTPAAITDWPPKGDNRQEVNLSNNVNGYYFTRGSGKSEIQYVGWEQDKQKFGIAVLSALTPKKDLLDIAKSMVNEPPIKKN